MCECSMMRVGDPPLVGTVYVPFGDSQYTTVSPSELQEARRKPWSFTICAVVPPLYRDSHQIAGAAAVAVPASGISDELIVGRPERLVNARGPGVRTSLFLVNVPNPELPALGLDVGDVLPIAGDRDLSVNIAAGSPHELVGCDGKLDCPQCDGFRRTAERPRPDEDHRHGSRPHGSRQGGSSQRRSSSRDRVSAAGCFSESERTS